MLFYILVVVIFSSCNGKSPNKDINKTDGIEKKPLQTVSVIKKITFKDIHGKWQLKYLNNYGYSFRFYRNFKSIIILYLKNYALVFKGVYTIEEKNKIRVNVFAVKNESDLYRINFRRGFTKTKSSHFIFNGYLDKTKKFLVIRPLKIVIDGNTSQGYFEPVIKLKRIK
ncbi:hypothetical protein ACFL20_08150 [Spirochaetota bacterium]